MSYEDLTDREAHGVVESVSAWMDAVDRLVPQLDALGEEGAATRISSTLEALERAIEAGIHHAHTQEGAEKFIGGVKASNITTLTFRDVTN